MQLPAYYLAKAPVKARMGHTFSYPLPSEF